MSSSTLGISCKVPVPLTSQSSELELACTSRLLHNQYHCAFWGIDGLGWATYLLAQVVEATALLEEATALLVEAMALLEEETALLEEVTALLVEAMALLEEETALLEAKALQRNCTSVSLAEASNQSDPDQLQKHPKSCMRGFQQGSKDQAHNVKGMPCLRLGLGTCAIALLNFARQHSCVRRLIIVRTNKQAADRVLMPAPR